MFIAGNTSSRQITNYKTTETKESSAQLGRVLSAFLESRGTLCGCDVVLPTLFCLGNSVCCPLLLFFMYRRCVRKTILSLVYSGLQAIDISNSVPMAGGDSSLARFQKTETYPVPPLLCPMQVHDQQQKRRAGKTLLQSEWSITQFSLQTFVRRNAIHKSLAFLFKHLN